MKIRAKEYLEQIAKIDLYIKNKLIERQQWVDVALGVTAEIGNERVQSSGDKQRMATAVAKYVDIEEELNEQIQSIIDRKRRIISVLEKLDGEEYDFLHMVYVQHIPLYGIRVVYVQHIPLKEVAKIKHYSYSGATTFHGRALQHVQHIIDSECGYL